MQDDTNKSQMYREILDTLDTPGWKHICGMLAQDKSASEMLLLDHGAVKDGVMIFKLKTDQERGFQLGQHKMAVKYLFSLEKNAKSYLANGGK